MTRFQEQRKITQKRNGNCEKGWQRGDTESVSTEPDEEQGGKEEEGGGRRRRIIIIIEEDE